MRWSSLFVQTYEMFVLQAAASQFTVMFLAEVRAKQENENK